MKKSALMAAVAAVSLLTALPARAADNASGVQPQAAANQAPIKLEASTPAVIPDSEAIRGQVTAHRTDDEDTGSTDEDDDSKDPK